MIAIFSGSGYLSPKQEIGEILITDLPELVILGDARGVDTAAKYMCQELNIPHIVFTAQWKRYGRSAGKRRNQDMIDAAFLLGNDAVLYAFPHWEVSPGTYDCINRAKRAGLEVEVYDQKPRRREYSAV